ncbi:hypothetical protein T4E_8796 [Trichinella pseudospiralis]|uniref:Uncharacterized protein n=1 Tax=Trichinella pseudospiralis TaxID=6337 RepID=A0A0V0XVQ9_TRIPS|nr:hypothetical protein T4E_8796 [Trichinella pseudospiralis]
MKATNLTFGFVKSSFRHHDYRFKMDRLVNWRFNGGASHSTKQTLLVTASFAVELFKAFQHFQTNAFAA